MPLPKGRDSNIHVFELLNRAIESQKGIKVPLLRAKQAWQLRMQCYARIRQTRKETLEMYAPTDPSYGRGPFDSLRLYLEPPYDKKHPDRDTTLVIEKVDEDYFENNGILIYDL